MKSVMFLNGEAPNGRQVNQLSRLGPVEALRRTDLYRLNIPFLFYIKMEFL